MRILLVEDDAMIGEAVQTLLRGEGHAVDWARDGLQADAALCPGPGGGHGYDMVLLDLGLPGQDGLQVLRRLRGRRDRTPVLVATARDAVRDRIAGLDAGADDYVVKPFNPAEVVARVEAVLRRSLPREEREDRRILRAPPFVIDFEQHEVVAEIEGVSHTLVLTLTEFKLLAQLARAPRRVFSRAELLATCLPEGDTLERTVDSHVSKLRKKLEDLGLAGIPVSIRGVGYRFQQGG